MTSFKKEANKLSCSLFFWKTIFCIFVRHFTFVLFFSINILNLRNDLQFSDSLIYKNSGGGSAPRRPHQKQQSLHQSLVIHRPHSHMFNNVKTRRRQKGLEIAQLDSNSVTIRHKNEITHRKVSLYNRVSHDWCILFYIFSCPWSNSSGSSNASLYCIICCCFISISTNTLVMVYANSTRAVCVFTVERITCQSINHQNKVADAGGRQQFLHGARGVEPDPLFLGECLSASAARR